MTNQFLNLSEEDRTNQRPLVTFSAGNYGKAFAYVSQQFNMPGIVWMPESAPMDRQVTIEVSLGIHDRCSCDRNIKIAISQIPKLNKVDFMLLLSYQRKLGNVTNFFGFKI